LRMFPINVKIPATESAKECKEQRKRSK